MKNMADYYDHYLKKDVLLLADVFGKFTRLSWNAMLKMTGIELKKKLNKKKKKNAGNSFEKEFFKLMV